MKILHLEVQDLKAIKAVEIDPTTGKPIVLTGDNGQGKSSILDAIILALDNSGLEDPIRHGRPKGSVKLTLGEDKAEYTLERVMKKKGNPVLTLLDAAGLPVQKPQTFLNGLIGNYAFDPLAFTRLKAKEQVEALKAAAGLDFSELDAKRKEFYDQRTQIGKEGKDVKAQLEGILIPDPGTPEEEVSAVELMDELRKLEDSQRDVERAASHATLCNQNLEQALAEVKRCEARLAEARRIAEEHELYHKEATEAHHKALAAAPTTEAIEAARAAVATVDQTNRAIRSANKHRELSKRRQKLLADYATVERRIEEIDEKKAEAIKNADLPLDGLELTDDGVMVNGTFFTQLSTAEQIRVSTLVAMSQNPALKIVLIREGALLNRQNLAMITELAKERDYQVWIERFQEDAGSVGFHIVDGAVAYVDGEPVETSQDDPETAGSPDGC